MQIGSKIVSLLVAIIVVLGGLIWGTIYWSQNRESEIPAPSLSEFSLSPEIEEVLSQKIILVEELARDAIIVREVEAANRKNRDLSSREISFLDERWRASKEASEFIRPFLTNAVALRLLEFQEKNPGFPEIFVTDSHGLNVGQTDRTTDYYQADEEWWVGVYAGGEGRSYHGGIEFDESAQSEAISIYVPVLDPETRKAIGVIKAVFSIAALKSAL